VASDVNGPLARAPRRGAFGHSRGTSLLEFTLTVPIFVVMLVGMIDLGRAVWTKHMLHNAVTDVARYASVHSEKSGQPVGTSDLMSWAKTRAVGLANDRLSVMTVYDGHNQPGGVVRVQMSYVFEPIVPFLPLDNVSLSSSARRVITY